MMDIHNHLPEKIFKLNTSIPLNIKLLITQKQEIKRAFIKTRNPFLKSDLKAISKMIKKHIRNHWTADIKKRIQSFQLSNGLKSWRSPKK